MASIQIQLSKNLYIRDPQDTELGRKIIKESIQMIDEMGFEKFTFKKLALKIESTEASIYRYFENKHRILIYLIAWYWNWVEYLIDYQTNNIEDPLIRLETAIRIVTEEKKIDPFFPDINETALHRIVIAESDKTYLTKQVDEDNKEGLFRGYKTLCRKIASIVQEINPDYRFPHSLISTVMQASHQQIFYSQHLPSLTDLDPSNEKSDKRSYNFLFELVIKAISK
jgi:AcrR family transcriptional regulator